MQAKKKRKAKRIWVLPIFSKEARQAYGAGGNLTAELQLNVINKYYNYFRMDLETFGHLLSLVGPKIAKVEFRREPINSQTRLGITLRYLATGDSMVSLSYLYRVGVSTVSEIIIETTQCIWEVLQPLVLSPPKKEDWLEISRGFQSRWNFPNCIGSIDGKHIKIQAPPNSGSTFYNYKGYHSIVLMAICDYKYQFTLIDVGASGRQSDGGVFASSEFGRRMNRGELNIPDDKKITGDGRELPFIFVGDEAFPLLPNLLKPYPRSRALDVDQLIFNYRLSRARLVIENSFGILTSKWRIFSRTIIANLENVEKIVKATVCLHNLIMEKRNCIYFTPDLVDRELNGNVIPGSWRKHDSIFTPINRIGTNTFRKNTKLIRDTFKDYFNEEGAISWQWERI